jgi:hypothetical protein
MPRPSRKSTAVSSENVPPPPAPAVVQDHNGLDEARPSRPKTLTTKQQELGEYPLVFSVLPLPDFHLSSQTERFKGS